VVAVLALGIGDKPKAPAVAVISVSAFFCLPS
jgi:hypothetical protein